MSKDRLTEEIFGQKKTPEERRALLREIGNFIDDLSGEEMDAAWAANFFIMARVEGHDPFLIPCQQKGLTLPLWFKDLKKFVTNYRLKKSN